MINLVQWPCNAFSQFFDIVWICMAQTEDLSLGPLVHGAPCITAYKDLWNITKLQYSRLSNDTHHYNGEEVFKEP